MTYYEHIHNRTEKAIEEGDTLEMIRCRSLAWNEWRDATLRSLETKNDLLALEYDEDLGSIHNTGVLRRRLVERRDRAEADAEGWEGIMDWVTATLKRMEEGA